MAVIDTNVVFEYVRDKVESGTDAIDALLTYGNEYNIEPEVLGDLCHENQNLFALMEEAAESMNLLEPKSRLQFDEDE